MNLVKINDEYVNFDLVRQVHDDGKGITIAFDGGENRHFTGFDGEEAEALRKWLARNSSDAMLIASEAGAQIF